MVNVGPMELIIVLVIALLVLGPKRLPEAGRAVGKGMREFKDSLSGITHDDDDADDDGGEPGVLRDGKTTSSSQS
jgi:sec-independent protein translocase protein TatA